MRVLETRLSPTEELVWELCMKGYSEREIAGILGRSRARVQQCKRRVRLKLLVVEKREALAEKG